MTKQKEKILRYYARAEECFARLSFLLEVRAFQKGCKYAADML
jgi:hypothetical protein